MGHEHEFRDDDVYVAVAVAVAVAVVYRINTSMISADQSMPYKAAHSSHCHTNILEILTMRRRRGGLSDQSSNGF